MRSILRFVLVRPGPLAIRIPRLAKSCSSPPSACCPRDGPPSIGPIASRTYLVCCLLLFYLGGVALGRAMLLGLRVPPSVACMCDLSGPRTRLGNCPTKLGCMTPLRSCRASSLSEFAAAPPCADVRLGSGASIIADPSPKSGRWARVAQFIWAA